MKVRVPKVIEVIIHPYKIMFQPYLKADENFRGYCNVRTQEIRIEPNLPPSQRTYLLFHEIGEAIKDAYNCGVSHDDLSLMATGYAEFFTKLGIELDWSLIKEVNSGS